MIKKDTNFRYQNVFLKTRSQLIPLMSSLAFFANAAHIILNMRLIVIIRVNKKPFDCKFVAKMSEIISSQCVSKSVRMKEQRQG